MRHLPTLLLQRHRRPRAWLVSLVLGMLVLMQSVGGIHGVLHRGDAWGAAPSNSPDKPFGLHTAHSADCQLFDQLAHADLAWLPPAGWTPPAAIKPLFFPADTPSAARRARSFRARDPPRTT